MEPARDRVAPIELAAAGQDEERGLEGVLGVVRVAEQPAADAEDHRPMLPHQGREG